MESTTLPPGEEVSLFVKNILLFEEKANPTDTILPFFADGYPGLVYQETESGMWVQPQNKVMPAGFFYGQTLHPIHLHLSGSYKMIVFQLYPFVLNSFFNVNPKELNDSCYDLQQVQNWHECQTAVQSDDHINSKIAHISTFLYQIFLKQSQKLDFLVKESLRLILDQRAQITIKDLCIKLHTTVRTFERRFLKEVGVSPKDFVQITRFQQSFEQLSDNDFDKLTDIVYANGFADQSHFIRVFKAFTGKTPSTFLKK